MDAYATEVERVMKRSFDSLSEKDRRRDAVVEATKLDHGGVEYMAGLYGCDPKTIRQGQASWRARTAWTLVASEKRGWTKTTDRHRPGPSRNFLKVIENHTAGDPMRADIKWTDLSRRQIAESGDSS